MENERETIGNREFNDWSVHPRALGLRGRSTLITSAQDETLLWPVCKSPWETFGRLAGDEASEVGEDEGQQKKANLKTRCDRESRRNTEERTNEPQRVCTPLRH